MKMINELKEWAKMEIELVKNSRNESELNGYYDAALEAFCKFVDIIYELDEPGVAKTIFTHLLHEEPLSPIEDKEGDWVFAEGFDPAAGNDNPGWTIYQCKRRSTLFKKVIYDRKTGEVDIVKFSDAGRYVCMDINTEQMYTGGMGAVILDEVLPITMPYYPIGKIKIFTDEFKCHEDFNGDFNTVGILYLRMPDGQMKEIKRYFKEDYKTHEMKEINMDEYLARKKKAESLMKKKINERFDS